MTDSDRGRFGIFGPLPVSRLLDLFKRESSCSRSATADSPVRYLSLLPSASSSRETSRLQPGCSSFSQLSADAVLPHLRFLAFRLAVEPLRMVLEVWCARLFSSWTPSEDWPREA